MSLPRITVEEVLEAYRETGMEPTSGILYLNNKGCAMGAICRYKELPWAPSQYAILEAGYGREYVSAFGSGFDLALCGVKEQLIATFTLDLEEIRIAVRSEENKRKALGFQDGIAAGRAVRDGVPPAMEVPDYPPVETEVMA